MHFCVLLIGVLGGFDLAIGMEDGGDVNRRGKYRAKWLITFRIEERSEILMIFLKITVMIHINVHTINKMFPVVHVPLATHQRTQSYEAYIVHVGVYCSH